MEEVENESDYFISSTEVRQCQKVEQIRAGWDKLVVAAMTVAEAVNPFESDLPAGTIIPAVNAVDWLKGNRNCDIRPRLVDKSSGEARLLDSGSQISITAKKPEDKIDNSFRLVAVNGSKIDTYGIRNIEVKINRKSYSMPAVVCDIQQDILGMDFISKYKLNFEWDEFDQSELYLVDKKANIKTELQIVTVPTDTPRVHYLDSLGAKPPDSLPYKGPQLTRESNDNIIFQVSCVKKLSEKSVKKKSIEEQLKMHDNHYVEMIKAHPQLLSPSFTKGEPSHGVFHRIDTPPGHPPCRAKRRPIIKDSAKAAAGKAAWEQMERDGVIERVQADTNTEFSSALHIVDKPGGGARPCSDFCALNAMTVTDGHPLPLLKDFTSKIHGSRIFSVIDIRSAFFNVPILKEHRYKTLTLSPWGVASSTIGSRSGCPLVRRPGRSSWSTS